MRVTLPHEVDAFTLLGRNRNMNTSDNYIIQYYVDGQAAPNWRYNIAAVLDRESIAARVRLDVGFTRTNDIEHFFAEKGTDYRTHVRRQMYLTLAKAAFYKISTVDAPQVSFEVEAMIGEAASDRTVTVDLDWLRKVYEKAQLSLPGTFYERVSCDHDFEYDDENEIEVSAIWSQRVGWNSKDDRMELMTDSKGVAPKHRLTVQTQPLRLTDDPTYQQVVVDLAFKAAGLSNEKLPLN